MGALFIWTFRGQREGRTESSGEDDQDNRVSQSMNGRNGFGHAREREIWSVRLTLLPSAFCLLPSAFCSLPSASSVSSVVKSQPQDCTGRERRKFELKADDSLLGQCAERTAA